MTHQALPSARPTGADPGRQVAQLREVLRLVRSIAGEDSRGVDHESMLREAAWVSETYHRALPVVQRRFDALAGEAAGWAAAGVEALLAAGDRAPPKAAAHRLASQLDQALAEMAQLLR